MSSHNPPTAHHPHLFHPFICLVTFFPLAVIVLDVFKIIRDSRCIRPALNQVEEIEFLEKEYPARLWPPPLLRQWYGVPSSNRLQGSSLSLVYPQTSEELQQTGGLALCLLPPAKSETL